MRLNLSDRIYNKSTSKGNQIKFFKNNKYYKVDTLGYESLAEVVVSKILEDSRIPHIHYELEEVLYEVEKNSYEEGIACVSDNFRKTGNQIIPLGRLLNILGVDINSKGFNSDTPTEQMNIVLDTVDKVYPKELFRQYLANIFYIDMIFLNEDRHFNNILFIRNQDGEFQLAPVFDNGLSLLSSYYSTESLTTPLSLLIKKIKSKPFCSNFEKQCKLIGEPDIKITISLEEIEDFIKDFPYDDIIKERILNILRLQINKYQLNTLLDTISTPMKSISFGKENYV